MSEKMKHFRAKKETIEFGEEKLTMEPMTNGELMDFMDYLKEEFDGIGEREVNLDLISELIAEKPVKVINKIVKENFTQDTFNQGYPNDIYNVAVTFVDVNFTFLRHLSGPLKRIAQMLMGQQPQTQIPEK